MNYWHTLKLVTPKLALTMVSWLGFLGVVLSMSLGQLGRIEWQQAAVYPHDFFILVFLLSQSQHVLAEVSKSVKSLMPRVRASASSWVGQAFLTWLFLGMVVSWAQQPDITPWFYLARVLVYVLFARMTWLFFMHRLQLLRLLVMVSGVYMVWLALLQYVLIPDTRFLLIQGWDEHFYRLIGPLLDPNFSGILFILIGWYAWSLRTLIPKPLILLMLSMCLAAVTVTYSRASYLALLFSIGWYFLIKRLQFHVNSRHIFSVLTIIGLVLLTYVLAPKPGGEGVNLLRTQSMIARYTTSMNYLSSLTPGEMILGKGFYTPYSLATNSHARTPDNVGVLFLYSTGLIGTVLAGVWLVLLARKHSPPPIVQAILIALLVHAQFNNTLLEPFVMLYTLLGVGSFFSAKVSK